MILIDERDGLDAPYVFLRLYPEQCTDQPKAKNSVHNCKVNETGRTMTDDVDCRAKRDAYLGHTNTTTRFDEILDIASTFGQRESRLESDGE